MVVESLTQANRGPASAKLIEIQENVRMGLCILFFKRVMARILCLLRPARQYSACIPCSSLVAGMNVSLGRHNRWCMRAAFLSSNQVPVAPSSETSLGRYLGEIAEGEAYAVLAFADLASELERFGAPVDLVLRARAAATDEVRHAKTMQTHARRCGAAIPMLVAHARVFSTLLDLALHNAEEGCIRETYGALVALHQAECASDEPLRADMFQIAREEFAHAQLSHEIGDWLETKLTAGERAQVAAAKHRAFETLLAQSKHEPDADLRQLAGLPSSEVAQRMLMGIHSQFLAS
jgi:hypothetical protein